MTRADPLLSELRSTAEAEAAAIVAAARQEADQRLDAARARLAHHHDRALAERREVLEREQATRVDAARAAAGQATLDVRGRFIARVLEAARNRAAERWRNARDTDWVRRTLDDLVGYLPDGPAILHVPPGTPATPPADREWRFEALEDSSGIIVASADGSVRVDATLDHFLRAERAGLAQAIVRRVEDEP